MADPVKLPLRDVSAEQHSSMLEMLEHYTQRVKAGEITRLGIIYDLGGQWGTEFSRSDDSRIDGAMLIELGLRRLGFKT